MYAIYARQSVDRPDSISIESQLEFCRYEAHGEACRTYTDKGYSGKNTDRPHFQEMMRDIEQGLISKVIVYKLDRISRSILDFANMMELFQQYRVEFVSSTEKFDTSTPVGRAMLNVCIVFAQLERETIQKRVADAYDSRSRKSFYMGGRVPYGFRLERTVLHGVRTAKYTVCSEEAEQIRLMYALYAEPRTSYGDILRYFEAHQIFKNGKPWERARLADHLRNPVYVRADFDVYAFFKKQGTVIVSDVAAFTGTNGCYLYQGRDAPGKKSSELAGQILVLAPHEGLVPSGLWLACRRKCLSNKRFQPGRKAVNTWLAGKLKCRACGYALVRKEYPARGVSYYLCSRRLNSRGCGGCGTLRGEELETAVYREIRKKLAAFPMISGETQMKAPPETAALQIEQTRVEQEIEQLMARLSSANEVLLGYINQRICDLDGRKRALSAARSALAAQCGETQPPVATAGIMDEWERLDLETKRAVADCFIDVIYASDERLEIRWKI